MSSTRWLVGAAAVALVGCSGPGKDDGGHQGGTNPTDGHGTTPSIDSGSTSDSGTTTDTASTPTVSTGDPLVVAAIGFRYHGIYDQAAKVNNGFIQDDGSGVLSLVPAYFTITLADVAYFSGGATPSADDFCEVLATFEGSPTNQSGTEFDYDAQKGGTGVDLTTYGFFEGKLTILPSTVTGRCTNLDTDLFPTGEPLNQLDGMHFGFGFGPLSPYIEEQLTTANPPVTDTSPFVTNFIAVNEPDGSGGTAFEGYDWDDGFYVDTDFDICGTFQYTTTTTGVYECGEPKDDGTNYLPGDATIPPLRGYIQSGALWFEDVPNMDLTKMKEGA